jgi:6-pyruvoyltetrahydropterin/6-carboxytetrahydropterin synthase
MPEKFVIRVESRFEAAHNLRSYYGKPEPLHGHSWRVEVAIATGKLDREAISVDYVRVKKALDGLARKLDYGYINDRPPFTRINPSSENIAKWFYREMNRKEILGRGRLEEVTVWEGPFNAASYSRTR